MLSRKCHICLAIGNMASKLKSEIAGLQRKLSKLDVAANNASASASTSRGTARKRRNRGRDARVAGVNPNTPAVGAAPAQKSAVSRASRPRGINADGSIRVSRREYLSEVFMQTDPYAVELVCSSFPWLNGLSKSFDRVKWHRASIIWRPCVAATTNGSIVIGIDWDSNQGTNKADYGWISCLTPCMESPLWQPAVMNLPTAKLQSRKEYAIRAYDKAPDIFDRAPGVLIAMATGSTKSVAGHIWVEYDITLSGTVQP